MSKSWQETFKACNSCALKDRMHRFLDDMFPDRTVAICGVEVGVCDGLNAAAMLKSCSRLDLTGVDPWWLHVVRNSPYAHDPSSAPQKVHAKFNARFSDLSFCLKAYRNAIDNVRPYRDRAQLFPMFSIEAALSFNAGSLDFVYLDGDHSYLGVKEDLEAWYTKVQVGGYLCGHDFRFDKSGVELAVMEFSVKYGLGLLYNTPPAHEWVLGPIK